MAVRIGDQGEIYTQATTHFESGRVFNVDVMTQTEITPEGVAMHTSMPHPIPRRGTIITSVKFSAEDLVTIFRWQLENADEEARERFRQALINIPRDKAIGWLNYFFSALAKPEP